MSEVQERQAFLITALKSDNVYSLKSKWELVAVIDDGSILVRHCSGRLFRIKMTDAMEATWPEQKDGSHV